MYCSTSLQAGEAKGALLSHARIKRLREKRHRTYSARGSLEGKTASSEIQALVLLDWMEIVDSKSRGIFVTIYKITGCPRVSEQPGSFGASCGFSLNSQVHGVGRLGCGAC